MRTVKPGQLIAIFLLLFALMPAGCRRKSNSFVIALGDNIAPSIRLARLRWTLQVNACVP